MKKEITVIKVVSKETGKHIAYLTSSKPLSYDQIEAISVMGFKDGDDKRYTKFLTQHKGSKGCAQINIKNLYRLNI